MHSYKKYYRVIGLMSGTSLDGLDLASCLFTRNYSSWDFTLECATTVKYSVDWINLLKESELSRNVENIDYKFGVFLAQSVQGFIKNHQLSNIDLIASHGHTLFHEPEKGITVQIGNGAIIAKELNIDTVSNFRQADVLLGGQGAPLVPIGDQLLFKDFPCCINVGGFANLSKKSEFGIAAWDICPANYVLNSLCNEINTEYDNEGNIARTHAIHLPLLNELNSIKFYEKNPPKSLAREWVNENIWPILNRYTISIEEKIATFTEHAAIQIAESLPTNAMSLFTGGGTYNTFLMERIQHYNPAAQIVIPSNELIEYKEALVFAFLGLLRYHGEVNILSSVTGATKDHSSGDLHGK